MGKQGLLVKIITILVHNSSCFIATSHQERVVMTQQQSCYYQPHDKELVCQCRKGEDKSYLNLQLKEFIIQAGQEISSILLHSCPDLLLHLDFLGVSSIPVQTMVRNSQKVRLESVTLDQEYLNRQTLKLAFSNIGQASLSRVNITEALEVDITNVKSFLIINSTFSHIPHQGLRVSKTGKLEIKGSTFARVHPMSVVVEKTKVVEVMNNEFSTDAIQVISYKDGSSVFISCNRLLGEYVKPECFTTTTASTTTITTTATQKPTTTTTATIPLVTTTYIPSTQSSLLTTLVVLLCLLIIGILLAIAGICWSNWTRIKAELSQLTSDHHDNNNEETELLQVVTIPLPPPPPPPVEVETLLHPQHSTTQQLFAPVWMQEIQKNKIFNKQKSINQELEGKENQDKASDHIDEYDTLSYNDDNTNDVDHKENSKTESDQDQD